MPNYTFQYHAGSSPISTGSKIPAYQSPVYYTQATATPAARSPSAHEILTERRAPEKERNLYPGVPLSHQGQHQNQRTHQLDNHEAYAPNRDAPNVTRPRASSLSRSLSRVRGLKGEREEQKSNDKGDVRSGQYVDIASLEAQLLPSLRDTIDRMAHPQKPNAKGQVEGEYGQLSLDKKISSPHDLPQSPPYPSVLSSIHSQLHPHHLPSQGGKTAPVDPKSPPQTTPQLNVARSAPSSPNPALKSSLKSPSAYSRLAAPPPPVVENRTLAGKRSEVLKPPGSSSRAGAPSSPQVRPVERMNHSSSPETPRMQQYQREGRGSSRAVPDRNDMARPGTASPARTAPWASTSSSPYTSPSGTQMDAYSKSGIPRPNYHDPAAGVSDSGSELARWYERKMTGGRLVVTNALVVPSSSESEAGGRGSSSNRNSPKPRHVRIEEPPCERESSRRVNEPTLSPVGGCPTPVLSSNRHVYAYTRPEKRLGLGFQFNHEPSADGRDQPYGDSSEEDQSACEEEASAYEEDISPTQFEYHRRSNPHNYRDSTANRKQQAALMSVVNHSNFSVYPARGGKSRLSQDESQYDIRASSIGLAIGDARDLQRNGAVPTSSPRDSEEIYYQRDEATHGRQRGSFWPGSEETQRRVGRTQAREQDRDNPRGDSQRFSDKKCRRSSSVPPGSMHSGRGNASSCQPESSPGAEYHHHIDEHGSKHRRRRTSTGAGKNKEYNPDRSSITDSELQTSKRSRGAADWAERLRNDPAGLAREAVEKEREGFGIPTSLSFCGNEERTGPRDRHLRLLQDLNPVHIPHTESILSNVVRESWDERTSGGQLSNGAEALFRKLSVSEIGSEERKPGKRRKGVAVDNTNLPRTEPVTLQAQEPRPSRMRHSRSLSESSSMPSVYEEDLGKQQEEQGQLDELEDIEVEPWRSSMPPEIYEVLLAEYGPSEMRRQNVIYQFFAAEDTFVSELRMILRQFIRPLRHRDSKNWIEGVPVPIARLFDWFDDIINLHLSMAIALKSARHTWRAGGVILKVAETLATFIPRLEIYQPYLVRVKPVAKLIKQCASDGKNEFGEFVKIREREPECGGWSLEQLLHDPVKHLGMYPETFLRIWRLTGRDHPDHLPMLSLYHSTQMTLRVMAEVRDREEGYEFIKALALNTGGLSSFASSLATRERRLLWEGALIASWVQGKTEIVSASVSPRTKSQQKKTQRFERSDQLATPRIVIGRVGENDSMEHQHVGAEGNGKVQVHVLTDMVVLTVPTPFDKSRRKGEKQWQLMPGVGIARVLSISLKESKGPDGPNAVVDLLPVSTQELESDVIAECAAEVKALRLSLPSEGQARGELVAALQRCHTNTLRSLSFPTHSGQFLQHGPHVDLELDTERSVAGIMSTGLPLPKSPSMQLQDARMGKSTCMVEQEREERGWWTLRFQQVLREMQRQDPVLSLNLKAPTLGL